MMTAKQDNCGRLFAGMRNPQVIHSWIRSVYHLWGIAVSFSRHVQYWISFKPAFRAPHVAGHPKAKARLFLNVHRRASSYPAS